MDQKKSLIVNIVLAVAVVILFVLHFTSGKETIVKETVKVDTQKTEEVDLTVYEDTLADLTIEGEGLLSFPIAYVDKEKFFTDYKLITESSKALQKKYEVKLKSIAKEEQDLQLRAQTFQNEIQSGLITDQELAVAEDNSIKALYESIVNRKQAILEKSQEEEAELTKKIVEEVDFYLKANKDKFHYSYVLFVSKNDKSSVLYANEALDITDKLVAALNRRYASSK